jgi:hypothetical protein
MGSTRAAAIVGVIGVLAMIVPRLDAHIRARFVERMAVHAATSRGGEARLAVRRLADAGPLALASLVRLAASPNADAAEAARNAVLNQLAAWEIAYRVEGGERTLARRLKPLSAALASSSAFFKDASRVWAESVSLQIIALCEGVSAGEAAPILACCDHVLSAPAANANVPSAARRPVRVAAAKPQAAQASNSATKAQAKVAAAPAATSPPPRGRGDVRVLSESPPERTAPPSAPSGDEPSATPDAAVVEPPPPREAPPADALPLSPLAVAPSLPPSAHAEPVVDVPSPAQARRVLRWYRQQSEQDLAARLATAIGHERLVIQEVLRQRHLAARRSASSQANAPEPGRAERELIDRLGNLPPAAARTLLRKLVADDAEDPALRHEALTLLATSGDPQLVAIARQRAIEDADPRVAELATQILRELR